MPALIPVKAGTYEPVRVKLLDGSMLMDGKKPAEFSRRDAIRTACYPKRLAAWLKLPGHSKAKPGKAAAPVK